MIIKHLELKNQTYRTITLNGLTVKLYLNGKANAASTDVDLSKSTIKLVLKRNSEEHIILSDNLKLLGLASSVETLNQSVFSTVALNVNTVQNATTLLTFTIPFLGHINLRGDDEIYIEVQNSQGLFVDPLLEPTSYLEIKPWKSVGVERFIPKIMTKVIQANEQSNQYNLGDNLLRLVLLNYDKTDFKNNVVNNVAFNSDRLKEQYTYADLVLHKVNRYGRQLLPSAAGDLALGMQEDQCFVLIDNQEFDAVDLEIQFQAANVAASMNYLVYWTFSTDWTIIEKANATDQKHMSKAVAKLDEATAKKK